MVVPVTEYQQQRYRMKNRNPKITDDNIVYTRRSTGNMWHFSQIHGETIQVSVTGNLPVDNSTAVRAAVLAGVGIAVCPVWRFGDLLQSDRLRVVLKEYQAMTLPIYAVYRRGRFVPAKVRCFIDYLTQEFKINPWAADDIS